MHRGSSRWLIAEGRFAGMLQILAQSWSMTISTSHARSVQLYVKAFIRYKWMAHSKRSCAVAVNEKRHGLMRNFSRHIPICTLLGSLTASKPGTMAYLLGDSMA